MMASIQGDTELLCLFLEQKDIDINAAESEVYMYACKCNLQLVIHIGSRHSTTFGC